MFSCEYCEIFKNTSFEEHLRTTASGRAFENLDIFQDLITFLFESFCLFIFVCLFELSYHLQKWQYIYIYLYIYIIYIYIFLIGIHSMQAKQPLRGMELQEKKNKKHYRTQKVCLERTYS